MHSFNQDLLNACDLAGTVHTGDRVVNRTERIMKQTSEPEKLIQMVQCDMRHHTWDKGVLKDELLEALL